MFYEHAEEFGGLPVIDFERGGQLADPETTAYRIRVDYEDEHPAVDLLTEMLNDPAVDRLAGLVIGAWAGEDLYESTSSEIMEAVVSAAPQLASLKALFLGDIISEENEVSWIQQSDLSPVWSAFPRLEHFKVRGSEGLSLGSIAHDHLKSLVIECGGLPRTVLGQIATAKLPVLEHLQIFLGTDGYGWDGSLDDVRPLFQEGLFPKLTYLGFCDSEIADDLAQALADSSILKQLKVLDLSQGTLGDDGGRALLACEAVRQLKKLDLHHHYMSDNVMQQLQTLPIEVDVSEQEDEDEYGRYVAVGE